ncbi:MAG: cytochrome c, partial [Gammaproteobacteria bacterium]|nr:cytochrome c [Gammaproteobacteria bacterium]
MQKMVFGLSAITLAIGLGFGGVANAANKAPALSDAEFDKAKSMYFQRCAGCHGVLRKGATGKNLEPKNTLKLGTKRLSRIIELGT